MAIAWSRSSSKVIAAPPPASEASRTQGKEYGDLPHPFVPHRARKGKQEVREHIAKRISALPDGWGRPLSRARGHTSTIKDPMERRTHHDPQQTIRQKTR